MIFCLILTSNQMFARDFEVNFRILTKLGYSRTNIEQEPYDNWQDNYRPPVDSMRKDIFDFSFWCDVGLEVEPILYTSEKKFSFGIPIYYCLVLSNIYPSYYERYGQSFSGRDYLTFDKTIAGIRIDWWNTVPLHKVRLRKTTPGTGFSIGWRVKRTLFIKLQGMVQKYAIISEDYTGIDNPGDVNTAKVVRSETIEKGLGYRFDLQFMPGESRWNFGIFYERNGSKIYQVGLIIRYNFYSFPGL